MSPVLAALQQGTGLSVRWGQGTQGSEQGDDKHLSYSLPGREEIQMTGRTTSLGGGGGWGCGGVDKQPTWLPPFLFLEAKGESQLSSLYRTCSTTTTHGREPPSSPSP